MSFVDYTHVWKNDCSLNNTLDRLGYLDDMEVTQQSNGCVKFTFQHSAVAYLTAEEAGLVRSALSSDDPSWEAEGALESLRNDLEWEITKYLLNSYSNGISRIANQMVDQKNIEGLKDLYEYAGGF